MTKVLVELFQKLARWRLRKPPRPSQRAKFPFRRSLLQAFLLRLLLAREKRLKRLCYFTNRMPLVCNLKWHALRALGKSVSGIRLRRRFARPAPCKRACRSTGGECEPTRLQANARTVDKAKEFCQFDKGFGRAFSKARAVEAA